MIGGPVTGSQAVFGQALEFAAERHRAVLAAGASAAAVALEVPLGRAGSPLTTEARGAGSPVGVVVEAPAHRRDVDATAIAPDDAERGRVIGLLTADLVAGAATVRTSDPILARRVRAVVAWLVASAVAEGVTVGPDGPDATVAP